MFFLAYLGLWVLLMLRLWIAPSHWLWLTEMGDRDYFLFPFLPFFASSVIAACVLVGVEWEHENPMLRYSVISFLFLLGVPCIFIWMKLGEQKDGGD